VLLFSQFLRGLYVQEKRRRAKKKQLFHGRAAVLVANVTTNGALI
jgi:hypothetical protein